MLAGWGAGTARIVERKSRVRGKKRAKICMIGKYVGGCGCG